MKNLNKEVDITSKHVCFSMNGNIHKAMKQYLLKLNTEKTMKEYITELIIKDLKNKNILTLK